MSNAEQLIWTRSQSKLESHQRERTVAHLAVAGKNLVSSRLFFLAERVRLDVLAKEKKNIDGMTHVIGEGQTQEKGKNGEGHRRHQDEGEVQRCLHRAAARPGLH